MKEALSKFKDEIVLIMGTRVAWLILGIMFGNGGDMKSAVSTLISFIGV